MKKQYIKSIITIVSCNVDIVTGSIGGLTNNPNKDLTPTTEEAGPGDWLAPTRRGSRDWE